MIVEDQMCDEQVCENQFADDGASTAVLTGSLLGKLQDSSRATLEYERSTEISIKSEGVLIAKSVKSSQLEESSEQVGEEPSSTAPNKDTASVESEQSVESMSENADQHVANAEHASSSEPAGQNNQNN